MTTQRRAKTCARCAFPDDHILHFRNCIPTSQWPRALRDRKAAAMNHPVAEDTEREPERVKPQGLAEYRRLHPEANPLTTENITVREHRKRTDGKTDEWERVVGVREAMNQAQPCPRCKRPLLDRSMHITCQPVDGSVIPDSGPRNPLKRDDVLGTPRTPVVHTTADVRSGAAWYESLPQAEEPEPDEEEMRDFLGDSEPDAEMVDPEVLAKVIAEQESYRPVEPVIDVLETARASDMSEHRCEFCDRSSPTRAGIVAHMRSHKADA